MHLKLDKWLNIYILTPWGYFFQMWSLAVFLAAFLGPHCLDKLGVTIKKNSQKNKINYSFGDTEKA